MSKFTFTEMSQQLITVFMDIFKSTTIFFLSWAAILLLVQNVQFFKRSHFIFHHGYNDLFLNLVSFFGVNRCLRKWPEILKYDSLLQVKGLLFPFGIFKIIKYF